MMARYFCSEFTKYVNNMMYAHKRKKQDILYGLSLFQGVLYTDTKYIATYIVFTKYEYKSQVHEYTYTK